MIYLEILQKFITAITISFSGAIISDSGSGFADFAAGDKIIIKGSLNGSNDGFRKIHTATDSSITVLGADFTAESAGNSIEIYKIEFFSDPATMHDDERGITRFYNPGILSIGEIGRTADGAFVRLNDGAITLNRQYLLGKNVFDSPDGLTAFDLQDKTKLFTFTIRLSYDDTKLFDGVIGIIRQLDEMGVTFQLKTEKYEEDYLEAAPNINSLISFTQGRFYPKVTAPDEFFNPLLMNDSTFEYYIPLGLILNVRDDGVIVPFQGVTTNYGTPGQNIYYNKKKYERSTSGGNATMSPTGAATDNTDWLYVSDGGIDNFLPIAGTSFQLFSTPVGEVTVLLYPSTGGASGDYDDFMIDMAGLIAVPGNFILGDGIAFVNATKKITDTQSRLGVFFGAGTNISGQQILITGGANDGLKYTIASVASDGSEIVLTEAPINEVAGATIKIQGYFGFDYSDVSMPYLVSNAQKTQISVLEKMKQISNVYGHIFYINPDANVFKAVPENGYSEEYSINSYEIDIEGGVSFLTKDVISSFFATSILRYPIDSPVILETIETRLSKETGIKSGSTVKVEISRGGETLINLLLDAKVNLYLNYDRIEIKYTIDGPGIDTRLKPGVKINFDAWISGELYVQEVIWNIEQGQNIVRGIANNIVFEDIE